MSIKKLAQDALFVQNACNLTGVLFSWVKVSVILKEMFPDLTQAELNQHPINILYSSKLADLAKAPYDDYQIDDDCSVQQMVKCWSLAVADLRKDNPGMGTNDVNKHPVNRMFAGKLTRLTASNHSVKLSEAVDQCTVWSTQSE